MANPPSKTPEEAGKPRQQAAWGQFLEGFDTDHSDFTDNRFSSVIKNSALNPRGYQEVFNKSELGPGEKVAYVAGRVAHDLLTDGSRLPYWAFNHPLAITGAIGEEVAIRSGLSPDYAVLKKEMGDAASSREAIDVEFARRNGYYHAGENTGAPLALARYAVPALATAAVTLGSDNTNYLNPLNGGRTAGFQSILPVEGDTTTSSNPILELGARYLFGRTGRVLPWEEFHAERPDVSFDDYNRYAAYQFDKGPLGLGLVKGTSRNLDGEPEAAMMGFRVPLSAAAAGAGALAGSYFGATQADHILNEAIRDKVEAVRPIGNRRLAGATIGAVLGAVGGKITGILANDLVVQPILNPRAITATEAWQNMSEEQRIAIAKGKSDKHDQGTQLALTQA
jgi:hypothetical protein